MAAGAYRAGIRVAMGAGVVVVDGLGSGEWKRRGGGRGRGRARVVDGRRRVVDGVPVVGAKRVSLSLPAAATSTKRSDGRGGARLSQWRGG